MRYTRLKPVLVFALLLACTVSLSAGGGGEASSAAGGTVKIKIATNAPMTTPAAQNLKELAENLTAKSQGRIQATLFTDGQLGNERDAAEGVKMGTIEMSHNSVGSLAIQDSTLNVFSAPYIWRDEKHLMNVIRGPIGKKVFDNFNNKTGIKILDGGWIWGVRHLTTKGIKVNVPADIKGEKIRAPEIPIFVDMISSWGALPVAVQTNDVFMALQTSMARGQENPITAIYAWRYYEIQDNLILTGHMIQVNPIFTSNAFFTSLSPENQKLIQDETIASGDKNNSLMEKSDRESLEKMKALGVTITTPDKTAFQNATKPVHQKYMADWGEALYNEILNAK